MPRTFLDEEDRSICYLEMSQQGVIAVIVNVTKKTPIYLYWNIHAKANVTRTILCILSCPLK